MPAALAAAIALVAIWVAYPLAMALLAAVSRRRVVQPPDEAGGVPRVSVVLATRDDPAAIRARVQDCLAADYDPRKLQVVVALDARGATRREDVADLQQEQVTVVSGDEPGGKAATLNAGVRAARAARGDVVVFADTHQRFEAAAVRELARAVRQPGVGVAGGTLVIPVRSGNAGSLALAYWRYERWLRRSEAQVHSCVGVSGSIYALRRELWSPLPANLILDDVYIPMKAALDGWRIDYTSAARAIETRGHSTGDEFRRKVRTLTGVLQLCSWLPGVLAPIRNPIWVPFVFHKLLRLVTPYLLLVALAGAVIAAGSTVLIAAAAAALAAGGAGLIHRPWARRLGRMMSDAVMLNWAVLLAGYNGLRGRWHVWNK